jgi:hypothetical protein
LPEVQIFAKYKRKPVVVARKSLDSLRVDDEGEFVECARGYTLYDISTESQPLIPRLRRFLKWLNQKTLPYRNFTQSLESGSELQREISTLSFMRKILKHWLFIRVINKCAYTTQPLESYDQLEFILKYFENEIEANAPSEQIPPLPLESSGSGPSTLPEVNQPQPIDSLFDIRHHPDLSTSYEASVDADAGPLSTTDERFSLEPSVQVAQADTLSLSEWEW